MRKASSLLPPLQRLPPLIKCKKKLSFLWPFIIACGICWSFFKPENFSAKKTEEEKRAAAVKGIGELSLLSQVRRRRFFWRMPPIVCSRLFVWPSTLWPCTKCDRNIFSFYEKIPLIFWPAAAVSLQWISLPFRTIVAAIFCHPKYVTHVLCHTCSLAVLHVVMWRTKVSWSNTIQGLSNFVGGVSCHVITLLLRKMSCFFCDFRAILVSLWLLKEIAQANYYVLRHLSSFFKSNINKDPRYECSLAHTKIALRSSLMDEIMDYFAFCIQGH